MVSVTTSFFETLIASNELFGVVDSTDGSTYSANLFVVAVAFLGLQGLVGLVEEHLRRGGAVIRREVGLGLERITSGLCLF